MSKLKQIRKFLANNKHQHFAKSNNEYQTYRTFNIEVSKSPFEPDFSVCIECENIDEAVNLLQEVNTNQELDIYKNVSEKLQERLLNKDEPFHLTLIGRKNETL